MKRPPLKSFLKSVPSPIQQEDLEPELSADAVVERLKGKKGDTGIQGPHGEKGEKGDKGDTGPQGIKGERGIQGHTGPQGERGESTVIEDIEATVLALLPEPVEVPEITPKEVIEKINVSRGIKIKASKVEGLDELEGLARSANRNVQNFISLGGNRQTKLQLNGIQVATGADTLNFIGGTLVPVGDGSTVSYTPPSSGGGGSGYQAPLSGGLTGTNTWTTAPNVIVVDGVPKQKTNTDGTVNWTGTTTTVLSVAPNYDIYATA